MEHNKLNISPHNVGFSIDFIDRLINMIADMSEKNARQIRHGATILTANKSEAHIMGGVEALSGFGFILQDIKQTIIKEYEGFIEKNKEESLDIKENNKTNKESI